MIYFLSPRRGAFGIREFLETYAGELTDRFRFVAYEDLAGWDRAPPGTYVLAGLDQLTKAGLDLVDGFERQLRAAGPGFRVLNSARSTLQRFELLRVLHREGLNRHGVARVGTGGADVRYPVFLREEHQHNGAISPLLGSAAEVRAAVAKAIVLGYRPHDLLLVEYFDAADAAGKYRKFAAHIIGDHVLPHFVDVGSDWRLHHEAAAFDADMFHEDQAYVRLNPHELELRRIFGLAKVEFGRIDYTVKDGRIETWEINLNPTFGRYPELPEALEAVRGVTTGLFTGRLVGAVKAIDLRDDAGGPIPIRFGPAAGRIGEAIVRTPPRRPWLTRVLWGWAPGRRLLRWGVELLSPLLVRARKQP